MATDFTIRQNDLFLPRKPLQTASRQKNRSDSENADAGCIAGSGTLCLRLWRLFILLLITSLLLSSLLSGSFADAWSGADGWMMGFLVQALSLFFAFLFSFPVSGDGEHARKFGTYCLYAGAGITIFLRIANRFRFYPFSYMGIDYTYLSTLGNIDWFCGYLSVVVPILMGDLYLARLDRQSGRRVYVKELLLVMSFLILILSGTESCYLILGGLLCLAGNRQCSEPGRSSCFSGTAGCFLPAAGSSSYLPDHQETGAGPVSV